jgi:Putative Ig domain
MEIKRLASILVLAATLVVAAVAPAGGISDEPCMNVAGENTNTCPPGKVGAPYSLRFVEQDGSGCGPGRQTFHFDSGELPPELTLAPDGTLSGVPIDAGTFQFYVEMREPQDDPTHCAGKRTQKQFTLRICDQLGVVSSPAPPPRAEVRVPFRMTLSSCGGVGTLVWTLSTGVLPAGLTLRADGSIAGAPKAAGTYRFGVTATDVRWRVASYAGTVSVARSLRIRTPRIPPARVDHLYRAKLEPIGGVAPTVWTIKRGRLPRDIRFDTAAGVLTGVAEKSGTHRVTVEVRDGLNVRAIRTFSFVVLPCPTPCGGYRDN